MPKNASECRECNCSLKPWGWEREENQGKVSPAVCPFRFCGEASAAGPPGIPGMASAEMDLCRGQHWRRGTIPQEKRHIWEEKQERMLKENPLTALTQKSRD